MVCFEGFCGEHYKLHSQKLSSHDKFLIVHKKQREGETSEDNEKQSKMLKLEISAEKAPEFDYSYNVEGDMELSQVSVNSS